MRPLNRPMFRYGGPIKEGIMQGMQDGGLANNEGPRRAALVGNPVFPKAADGRAKHYASLLAGGANVLRALAPQALKRSGTNLLQGFRSTKGTGPFDAGLSIKQRIRNIFPTTGFRNLPPTITRTKDRIPGATGSYSPVKISPNRMTLKEAFTSPKTIGKAIRENPGFALSAPSLATSATQIGGPVLVDTAKGIANFLVPGTRFDPFGPEKQKDVATVEGSMKRGDGGPKNVGEVGTDPDKKVRTDGEKSRINEDRINETKQKYYKLMGIDKMNKDAVYNSLINASQIVSEEGADLKGAIRSGTLQNRIIQAVGKNLDKSADLKKAIDSAVLKGEIQKDINLTKPSAFAEQVEYLRNNPNDPLARKLSGVTSVADNIAALSDKPLTSDIVGRLVESKGQEIEGIIKDDKFQKWEKNNEGKDEIDYLLDVYKGQKLDKGIYIINKKAISIDANGVADAVDLDSIIG